MQRRKAAGAEDPGFRPQTPADHCFTRMRRHWDIFCKVVDNFGDIGVCWRLARQLSAEHGAAVRLWVDDVGPLARIWPGIDAAALARNADGIDIHRWTDDAPGAGVTPGDVVVEAFACDTPPAFVAAMAARSRPPAWLNLEYLSAEDWVESHHMLPSPHPRLPLVKHFFFPGFTPRTGGLLREAGLLAARDAFAADDNARAAAETAFGLPPRRKGELRVSLFSYANPSAAAFLGAWARGTRPVCAVVPDGVLEAEIEAFFGAAIRVGARAERGALRLVRVPFVRQTDYDRLLWLCDVNFVRGEDSFVRAQWAGKPMAWQIYPQTQNAHWPKLDAFVARYADGPPAMDIAQLFIAWNGRGDPVTAWDRVAGQFEAWNRRARAWADGLATQSDLATQLVREAGKLL